MRSSVLFRIALGAALTLSVPAWAGTITYLGTGSLPGTATDFSGLTGTITGTAGTIPQNQLGAFGSGITYAGYGNLYVAVNDRGWSDGITTPSYIDRLQVLDVKVDPLTGTVTPTLVNTVLLTNANGQYLVGQTAAFDTVVPANTLRFDPEAVRVGRDGSLYISDEYGPYIYKFNSQGQQTGTIDIPSKYAIANPNANGTTEITGNTIGRQSNRGMEGLAISPDGTTLFGIMQNPLIQDGALNGTNRVGVNDRILKIDIATGATQEFVYPLSSGSNNGVNEILAVNDHQFLVLERDGRAGNNASFKRVYLVDVSAATDVSAYGTTAGNGLPQSGLPQGVSPVTKSLFLDLLNPAYGLAGSNFPEKIEGLAWGPDLPDGRHLLLVTNDNDLLTQNPNNFYTFAIDQDVLPGFQSQVIDAPFATPEPGAAGLLATGLVVLVALRRYLQ